MLGLHYGDLDSIDLAFKHLSDVAARALLEPQQPPQAVGKMSMVSSIWPVVFGKGLEFGSVLREAMGDTWASIEDACDETVASSVWYAPRGERKLTGNFGMSTDTFCWCAKMNLALCFGESAVSKQQMQSLPSPHESRAPRELLSKQTREGQDVREEVGAQFRGGCVHRVRGMCAVGGSTPG